MKYAFLAVAIVVVLASLAFALDGQPGIHDPSTIIMSDHKFYTYGTGGTALVSDDGWNWRAGTTLPRRGLAPDVVHIGDRYYVYVAANIGAQPKAAINMIWTKSLDPQSPDYKWTEAGVVVSTDGIEDCNGIDPGVFLDPNDGRLWLVYGSYFGYIRQVELDPKTGMRLRPNEKPTDLAINCEASDMMYHDGWYYLLATHGSCCAGSSSGYNIRMGRAKKVSGPFIDAEGIDMIKGGGKMLIGSEGRFIGPGHFGLLDLGDGVQKYSMHWEADLEKGGASVLDIRPLLWRDGWPVSGNNLKEGTYELESVRTGTALEIAVEGIPVGGGRGARGGGGGGGRGAGPGAGAGRGGQGAAPPAGAAPVTARAPAAPPAGGPPAGGGGGGRGMFGGTGVPIPPQDVATVSANWPVGNINTRMSNYLAQAQQKWTIAAAPNAGGYPGAPYFKITIAGTDRALAATEGAELVVLPSFTGAPEQLWRIEQLPDGNWRIVPKSAAGSKEPLSLSAVGSSFATLSKYDAKSDKQRWLIKTP